MTSRWATLILLGAQIAIASAGLLLDMPWASAAVLVLAVAVLAMELSASRAPGPPAAPLEPEQAGMLRLLRDEQGEIPAVRRLRRVRPELSLADAVQLIRGL